MQLKKGNAVTIGILVKDSGGAIVGNLSTATDVVFVMKINKTDKDEDAVVKKDLATGITVDDPSLGYIKIPLTSTDMDITAKNYFLAVQIIYSATNKIEINIRDTELSEINPVDSIAVIENIVHV